MPGYSVITGKVHSEPHFVAGGTESKPTLSVNLELRVTRRDYIKQANVADKYQIQVIGYLATKIKEEGMLAEGDEVTVLAEIQPHANGMTFFAKQIARMPDEGMDVLFACGAVESGKASHFDKKDGKSGCVVNTSLRIPTRKKNGDGHYSKNLKFAIWDRAAENFEKYLLPEGEEDDRKWAMLIGTSKNERQELDGGEVRYNFKTTANIVNYMSATSPAHENSYGGAQEVEGHSAGKVDDDLVKKMADAASNFDDDDIPF